ncbi:MAG: orotidine-5'-phosphate decarboxylase [Endomicrobium sp.]|nr:orotidine-5'-phosphate decarboxylase [Endomicrobium sp.]
MKKIILALDVDNVDKAKQIIRETYHFIDIYKVGPILFIQCGKEIIEFINGIGKKVFLDLKLYDIPMTVQRAVESAQKLDIFSLTVHSSGGKKMLQAATSVYNHPKIWAVSVLTSTRTRTTPATVIKRALLAKSCGLDGVISSPLEIDLIKKECGKNFNVITPGIRLNNNNHDDQIRVATPLYAINKGADFIVMGRSILNSKNYKMVLHNIYQTIQDN